MSARGKLEKCAGALALVALFAGSTAGLAQGEPRRSSVQTAIHATRLIQKWQYDEARELVGALESVDKNSPATRYARAELDFVDGRYQRVLTGLDGIPGNRFGGNVAALRQLAASTYQVTKNFTKSTSPDGHFEIWYEKGKDDAIVELAGATLDAAYRALGDDLGHRPKSPIRVEILGASRDLAEVSTLTAKEIETTGTIALCKYGKLMFVSPRATLFGYPWLDTLTHEYVHYVVTQMSAGTVPVWLHEGLARYLQGRWRGPATGALSAVDEHLLARALRKRKLIKFRQMHPSMAKLPSQKAAALAYAEVHTLVRFIHRKVGNDGLRRLLLSQRRGKSARKAVAETMGVPWEKLEKQWKRSLRAAKLESSKALAGRSERIRFKKGKGNQENVGVESINDDEARKYTRLAGMLRARRMAEAAALEYEKALAITGASDPFVAGKLSRTYLELGRLDEAIALAEPLVDQVEIDALPATTVGVAYLSQGNAEKSAAALEVALSISPFDPTIRCSLAKAYRARGDVRAEREERACKILR